MNRKAPLISISGPTGAGKSSLALKLAKELDGEIINADSLAFYRGFDIGTAKVKTEEMDGIPHHLIDILNPDENFDAAAYLKLARPLVEDLATKGRAALAVGGTGFYLKALNSGLFEGPGRDNDFRAALAAEAAAGLDLHARLKTVDPETAARLAPADYVRIERALEVFHLSGQPISQWQREHVPEKPFRHLCIIIDRPGAELDQRLKLRTSQMLEAGLIQEVKNLLADGWSSKLKTFGAIGYKEVLAHLRGDISLKDCQEKIYIATRRYAKRQRTWFKGQMPEAHHYHPEQYDEILNLIKNFA